VARHRPRHRRADFYEDFSGPLDPDVWKIAKRNWGGQVGGVDYNGGVIPELVSVADGHLVLAAHGNLYEGEPYGINKDLSTRDDGMRVGSAIATEQYFGSGRYEARMKIAPELGVASAFWTFFYQELYPGDEGYTGRGRYMVVNHEIDIEAPGRAGPSDYDTIAFDQFLATSWVGERGNQYTTTYVDLPTDMADGEFHVWRFDWHTGGTAMGGTVEETPRVEWYVDGELWATNTTDVPFYAGRVFLGAWFPNTWAGTPDFEVTQFEVDWVSFTAFHEAGDQTAEETYPDSGWAELSEWP
jgi:beta-glucanase (GH16 family)